MAKLRGLGSSQIALRDSGLEGFTCSAAGASSSSSSAGKPTSHQTSSSSTSGATSLTPSGTGPSRSSNLPSAAPMTSIQPHGSISQLPNQRTRRFFELCVNVSDLEVRLGELDITSVQGDTALFQSIHDRYHDLRAHRWQRVFMKPINIHFVLVRMLPCNKASADR